MQNILHELTFIFRQVFNNPEMIITSSTDTSDVEEWDSLQHLILILTIEKHFKIKFTTEESQKIKNVGELITTIEKNL